VALLATAFAVPFALVQPVLGPVGDALGKAAGHPGGALLAVGVHPSSRPFAPDLPSLAVLRGWPARRRAASCRFRWRPSGDAVDMRGRQVALSR
jgi:hypothetical protein